MMGIRGENGMRILSLFDGISAGLVALNNLGFTVDSYYSFEIDTAALAVSGKNHPDIIQCGDVLNSDFTEFSQIDLLLGGSPCQDLSIAKSKRDGLKGQKSQLFWQYKKALDTVKPKWFLFENVSSMKDEDKVIISQALGTNPIIINASSFLPQNRPRLYWTNIPVTLPIEQEIKKFSYYMQQEVPEKYYYKKPFKIIDTADKNIIGEIELNTYQQNRRVYNPNGIIGCLTCVSGGYQEKKVYSDGKVRKLTPVEYERLQGFPDGYTIGLCDGKRYSVLGNSWCIPVIEHILRGIGYD